ncbi:MAG TPA: type II toxin-antitoxin system prevent-host-death family antitoxin [Thermoanaerobaculia bacterium]|jgi:antitoxin YefM|nr:type II toxin-antitoxin system prevent-host-death family antitoxin [Thermoanaerobaculia bacterium]
MDSITYTSARANLAKTMDHVCESHEPVLITRSGQTPVVMLSVEDYNSLEETAYLLRSPKNAKRLIEAIADLEQGRGTERELAE